MKFTKRFRRAATAAVAVAAAGTMLSATTGADAATVGAVYDRGWSCPGNQVIANAPTMTSNVGTVNARWAPVVQKYIGNGQWSNYAVYNYENGVSSASGSSDWHWLSGQPSYGKYTVNVQPGSYYGGVYYPNYYRVVDYYQWANLSDQPITNWNSFVSGYAYCSF